MNIVIEISPNGYFQAVARSVGLTDDEARDVELGKLPMEKFEAMLCNVRHAMSMLADTETCGSC